MHEFNPFSTNKPKFLDILGFSDFNLDKDNKTLELKFNGQVNPLTLDINVQFLRPCAVGEILVRAKYIKEGRTIAYTSAELFQNDKIVASATATSKLV